MFILTFHKVVAHVGQRKREGCAEITLLLKFSIAFEMVQSK